MNIIETLAYAGLGMASEASDKAKAKFDELVETGKKVDSDGKNYVGDFFKTVESTKDTIENKIEKNKTIVFDNLPFLRELEVKMNEKSEEVKSTFKDSLNKAKDSFYSRNESESTNEETTIVEEK